MKFKIRDSFVVTITERVDVGDGKIDTQTQTFYGGKVVELTAEQAAEHAHKLEPADKAGAEFLGSMHVPGPEQTVQVDIDALVNAKVEAALAKMAAAGRAPA